MYNIYYHCAVEHYNIMEEGVIIKLSGQCCINTLGQAPHKPAVCLYYSLGIDKLAS